MRGVFEAGVIDVFLEKGLQFENAVGTSAGAMQAVCYLSGQKGRNIRINTTYCNDPRYMGWRHFFKSRNYFNFDFIFEEIANDLDPMDWETLEETKTVFYAVVTDVLTGRGEFMTTSPKNRVYFFNMVKASASIPLISPAVTLGDRLYVDGGVGYPCVPLLEDLPFSASKGVYILTREKGYRKKELYSFWKNRIPLLAKPRYRDLVVALCHMAERYNHIADIIEQREKEGNIFIFRPERPVIVKRAERDAKKLKTLYEEGVHVGETHMEELMRWIHG